MHSHSFRKNPESSSRRRIVLAALALASVVVTACGGGGTEPTKTPVASIDLSPSPLSVMVGQTSQLSATTKSAAGATLTGRAISWSSADQTIATVTGGSVTGVKAGSTVVTATSEGVHKDVTVTVSTIPIASIDLAPSPLTVTAGQTAQLNATAKSASGEVLAGRAMTWSSADQTIATISTTGLVTAVKVGSTVITATSEGISKDVTVNVVPIAVASVDVSPSPATVTAGQTVQLTATPKSAAGVALTDRSIVWTIANETIATISTTGLVNGSKTGSTTATATSEGVTKDVTVTVVAGAVNSLVFISQPTAAVAGAPIAPAVQVQLLDVRGNVVPSNAPVTLTLSGGATLKPSNTVNATNGVATFSGLFVERKGLGYSLKASAGSVEGTSNTFNISAAAPDTVRKRAGDGQQAIAGTTLPTAASVQVVDRFGNTVDTATVTFVASGSGSVTGGTAHLQSDANGIANVGSWTVGAMGPNTLTATAGSASATFTALVTGGINPGVQLVVDTLASSPNRSVGAGHDIAVPIMIDLTNRGTDDLGSIQVTINWDPTKLVYKSESAGNWSEAELLIVNPADAGSGVFRIAGFATAGTVTSFVLRNLVFTAASGAAGTSANITATVTAAGKGSGTPIAVGTRPLTVTVTP